jgi:hypothetical protein
LGEKTPHVDKAGKEGWKTQGILYSSYTGNLPLANNEVFRVDEK